MSERNEYFSGDLNQQPPTYVDEGALFDLWAKASFFRPIRGANDHMLVIEHDLHRMQTIAQEVEEWSNGARKLETQLDEAVILYRHTRIANPVVPDPMTTYFYPVSRLNEESALYSPTFLKDVLGDRKPLQISLRTSTTHVEAGNIVSLTPDYIHELVRRPTAITASPPPPRQTRPSYWRTNNKKPGDSFEPANADIQDLTRRLMRDHSGAIVLKQVLKPRPEFE